MAQNSVYLDYNATAPLRPEAREAFLETVSQPVNASSVHQSGRRARGLIEDARQALAQLVGCDAGAITFTSGGSEANETVLTPFWQIGRADCILDQLFVGATEHPSVLSGGRFSADKVTVLPVGPTGQIDLDALKDGLEAATGSVMISVMAANNETGIVQDLAGIRAVLQASGLQNSGKEAIFHVDAVQALGKINLDDAVLAADVLTLSGHKIGAPLGVGAIVRLRSDRLFAPLVKGGGQELGRRAGTENVGAIAGLGAVCRSLSADQTDISDEVKRLCNLCEAGMASATPGIVIFGQEANRLPNTICCALSGVKAETAMIAFDLEGICLSSGSACSSGKVGQSHVLRAMGVEADLAQGALRISLGWDTKEQDIERFLAAWRLVSSRLLKKSEKAA